MFEKLVLEEEVVEREGDQAEANSSWNYGDVD